MKNRNLLLFFAVALILGLVYGCASMGMKSFTDMTPKEKVTFMMRVYNKVYDNTMKMATDPNITPEQKLVVAEKKALLSKAYQAIKVYDAMVASGGITDPSMEDQILDLLDQLGGL